MGLAHLLTQALVAFDRRQICSPQQVLQGKRIASRLHIPHRDSLT